MVQTFQSSTGDIRAVMRTMIISPEFLVARKRSEQRSRHVRTCISAARALGTDVDTPMPLVQWTGDRRAALSCQPPTGYSDKRMRG